jgi:hypothetical protein
MRHAEEDVPAEAPETAPEETLDGSPAERTREASRHADRAAREDEAGGVVRRSLSHDPSRTFVPVVAHNKPVGGSQSD